MRKESFFDKIGHTVPLKIQNNQLSQIVLKVMRTSLQNMSDIFSDSHV